jgi:hypothetical protein
VSAALNEMEMVIGAAPWPKASGRAPRAAPEVVPHLCRNCLGQLERHAGGEGMPTFWCLGCGAAGREMAALCCCGVERAGVRLKCVKLASEADGPSEIVVAEANGFAKAGGGRV